MKNKKVVAFFGQIQPTVVLPRGTAGFFSAGRAESFKSFLINSQVCKNLFLHFFLFYGKLIIVLFEAAGRNTAGTGS